MPDDTTPASTTPETAAPSEDVSQLKARAEAAEAKAAAHSADADQAKRYLVDLVARLGQQQTETTAPAQAQDASPEELIEEFKQNPVGLLDRHFAARMGPVLTEHLEDRGKMNRQYFIDQNKEDWEEYGKEVDAFMAPMSLSTKAKLGSWQEGLNYIKAKHIDQIVEKRMKAQKEAEKRGLVEGRGASPGSSNGGNRPYRLSPLEKEVAKGFGMTEAEWIANKTPSEKGDIDEDIL
jgi:hypothetical protein